MMTNLKSTALLLLAIIACTQLAAQNTNDTVPFKNLYLKPYAGFIGIQNMDLQLASNGQNSDISVKNGFGFNAGIALGYRFSENISAEIGWEYKSNDITVTNGNTRTNGDYASNFIYLNGLYNFPAKGKLSPYVGLGASLIQEIDLDFGQADTSFSNSGNIGFQGIAGLDFNLSDRWALNWEAKYVTFGEFDMENEANSDSLTGLKYNPFIINIGLKFRF